MLVKEKPTKKKEVKMEVSKKDPILAEKKSLNNSVSEVWVFIQKLSATLFSLAILGLGIAAVYHGLDMTNRFYRVAVVVSGTCAVVDGLVLLYRALMKVGK